MKNYQRLLILLAFCISCQNSEPKEIPKNIDPPTERTVRGNTIISPAIPKIKIKVAEEFQYIGKFDFDIIANSEEYPVELMGQPVASGERLVFAVFDEAKDIEKLFIVQFEGFLASNDFIYHYDFSQADHIGKNKYRHNTWYYDARQSAQENPQGEGAKTQLFLAQKGFNLPRDWMMSRFVGLASADRKNEIILFYHEMLQKTTGYTLDDWEHSVKRAKKISIDSAFVERSRNSFTIVEE